MSGLGVDSEVGLLRAVILHRPGAELKRLTPRNNDALLFDGLPWVARAQEEHDAFAALLRSRGVEVLLLAELLTEALVSGAARVQGIAAAVDGRRLGPHLAQELSAYLRSLEPADLAHILMAGMTFTEFGAAVSPDPREHLRLRICGFFLHGTILPSSGGGQTSFSPRARAEAGHILEVCVCVLSLFASCWRS